MKNGFFALISRMRLIGRWGLMRSNSTENIQEHSHMVSVLAHALAVIRKEIYGKDCDANSCATVALYHDASEIFTGDMPTPIKYYDPDIQAAYKRVEHAAVLRLSESLPEALRPSFSEIFTPKDEEIEKIVKAADKLSAYIKCVEECSAGNAEFKNAKEQTYKALIEMQMPEVSYFLENFGDAFGLNLDELT